MWCECCVARQLETECTSRYSRTPTRLEQVVQWCSGAVVLGVESDSRGKRGMHLALTANCWYRGSIAIVAAPEGVGREAPTSLASLNSGYAHARTTAAHSKHYCKHCKACVEAHKVINVVYHD